MWISFVVLALIATVATLAALLIWDGLKKLARALTGWGG